MGLIEIKMNKKLTYVSLFVLILIGCGKKAEKLPEGILTKEEMIPVMVDIELAESAITIKALHGDSARQYASDYYNFIYYNHNVPKEVFNKSLDYYIAHPKELDEIYTEVITELSKKEALEGS